MKLTSLPRIFFIILIASSTVLSQTIEPFKKQIVLIEKNFLPTNNRIQLYLSFKVSYNNLYFVRKNEKFYGGVQIEFALIHSNRIINRETISKIVEIDEYDNSKMKDKYVEGVVNFNLNLENEPYIILPTVSIENTNYTIVLDSIKIKKENYLKEKIFFPLIAEDSSNLANIEPDAKNNCFDSLLFRMTNLQNSIPFSTNNYFLLIPIIDSSIQKVHIKIVQNSKTIYEETINKFYENNLLLKDCDNFVGLYQSPQAFKTKYFLIDNFSYKLEEGSAKLIITKNNSINVEYDLTIYWENKPKSLNDVEFAIQILEVIDDKNQISKIFESPKKDLYASLKKYWDNKFPNNKFAFNEYMNEFYKRVDYAMENFSTVTNRNGAKTDRGKVYIKYGKPDNVLRDYSNSKVREIWIYNNINKQFLFVDSNGLGNYILEE